MPLIEKPEGIVSQTALVLSFAREATTPVTGDYARDCAELAREALSHVGFTRFEETPFEDVPPAARATSPSPSPCCPCPWMASR